MRKELESRYAEFVQAYLRKDVQALPNYMTSDFQARQREGGTANRQETIATLQRAFGSVNQVRKSNVTVEKVSLRGNDATTTARVQFDGTITDRNGKGHALVADNQYRDTWTRTADGWKIRRSEPLRLRVTLDGKPLNRPGRPAGRAGSRKTGQ